ncbi:unnamed protein product [Rhizophagus irregularis]|nr:unnamed protein product [Rhizophagus irregularis]
MANIIDFRFKVHDNSDDEIFKIKIPWQTSAEDAIPIIKKGMATRYEQVPDVIKLYVDNPRGPAKELQPDDKISSAMSTITLSCLVVGENPYENVKVNKTEAVSELNAIKENQKPNVAPKELKLRKVDISLEEENEKLNLVNTKINVNIKEELGGEELPPLSKISKTLSPPASRRTHTYNRTVSC